jgi:hypothetical protein
MFKQSHEYLNLDRLLCCTYTFPFKEESKDAGNAVHDEEDQPWIHGKCVVMEPTTTGNETVTPVSRQASSHDDSKSADVTEKGQDQSPVHVNDHGIIHEDIINVVKINVDSCRRRLFMGAKEEALVTVQQQQLPDKECASNNNNNSTCSSNSQTLDGDASLSEESVADDQPVGSISKHSTNSQQQQHPCIGKITKVMREQAARLEQMPTPSLSFGVHSDDEQIEIIFQDDGSSAVSLFAGAFQFDAGNNTCCIGKRVDNERAMMLQDELSDDGSAVSTMVSVPNVPVDRLLQHVRDDNIDQLRTSDVEKRFLLKTELHESPQKMNKSGIENNKADPHHAKDSNMLAQLSLTCLKKAGFLMSMEKKSFGSRTIHDPRVVTAAKVARQTRYCSKANYQGNETFSLPDSTSAQEHSYNKSTLGCRSYQGTETFSLHDSVSAQEVTLYNKTTLKSRSYEENESFALPDPGAQELSYNKTTGLKCRRGSKLFLSKCDRFEDKTMLKRRFNDSRRKEFRNLLCQIADRHAPQTTNRAIEMGEAFVDATVSTDNNKLNEGQRTKDTVNGLIFCDSGCDLGKSTQQHSKLFAGWTTPHSDNAMHCRTQCAAPSPASKTPARRQSEAGSSSCLNRSLGNTCIESYSEDYNDMLIDTILQEDTDVVKEELALGRNLRPLSAFDKNTQSTCIVVVEDSFDKQITAALCHPESNGIDEEATREGKVRLLRPFNDGNDDDDDDAQSTISEHDQTIRSVDALRCDIIRGSLRFGERSPSGASALLPFTGVRTSGSQHIISRALPSTLSPRCPSPDACIGLTRSHQCAVDLLNTIRDFMEGSNPDSYKSCVAVSMTKCVQTPTTSFTIQSFDNASIPSVPHLLESGTTTTQVDRVSMYTSDLCESIVITPKDQAQSNIQELVDLTNTIFGVLFMALLPILGFTWVCLSLSSITGDIRLYICLLPFMEVFVVLFQTCFVVTAFFNRNKTTVDTSQADLLLCFFSVALDGIWQTDRHSKTIMSSSNLLAYSLCMGYMAIRGFALAEQCQCSWMQSEIKIIDRLEIIWTCESAQLVSNALAEINEIYEKQWSNEISAGMCRLTIQLTDQNLDARRKLERDMRHLCIFKMGYLRITDNSSESSSGTLG